jgi:hydrogenase maturation protein HypF
MPSMVNVRITLQGIVQGVGFRPFIYRLAQEHAVTGYVANTGAGVLIEAEGSEQGVSGFIQDINARKPPLARIHEMNVEETSITDQARFSSFLIRESQAGLAETALLPPDLDVCPECLAELFTPGDRRYRYPFINCTNCGPRYTIIEDLPYDRPLTAMKGFALCPLCAAEYREPTNRRFHAQANACPICGPRLELADAQGEKMAADYPLIRAADLLAAGAILAVKGLGGFHLAADAADEPTVARLRARKGRPHKPLAVMAADLAAVRRFAQVREPEAAWLTSREKPIVLLEKSSNFSLAASVAPGQRCVGVMLPPTPLHHLLLADSRFAALVMTSGNRSGEPIVKDNEEATSRLAGIADGFLWHNRPIIIRNDDSVLKLTDEQPAFFRRSRSFAPLPLLLATDAGQTLALGGAEKNTVCLTRGQQAFFSQHLGDLYSPAGQENYAAVIAHLCKVLRMEPELVVHDLHPDYPSSRHAETFSCPRVAVQHHHAHAVSCMAEHGLDGPVLAITLDGSGLGEDGTIWGGEVLLATVSRYQRLAHLTPFTLPGGEIAIRQPWRLALSLLQTAYGQECLRLPLPFLKDRRETAAALLQMNTQGVNAPITTSCGRLFDAVAALLDLRETITYDGQAAIELEMIIEPGTAAEPYPYHLETGPDGCLQMNPVPMIREIVDGNKHGVTAAASSNRFHQSLAVMLTEVCRRLGSEKNVNEVVLSGGVFQNMVLRTRLSGLLAASGFRVYNHERLPPNDGGLALGQAVAGRAMVSGKGTRLDANRTPI